MTMSSCDNNNNNNNNNNNSNKDHSSPSAGKKKKKSSTTAGGRNTDVQTKKIKDNGNNIGVSATISSANTSRPASTILILDSGGWTIKHGVLRSLRPKQVPNAVAKFKHQLGTLVADEIDTCVNNKAQLEITRPYERGYCTNLNILLQVWTRILELHGIATTKNTNTTTSSCSSLPSSLLSSQSISIPSSQVCLVILTQPFTPGVIQDAIDQTIFFDLGIHNIIQLLQPSMAAFRYLHGTNDNDPLLDNIISAAPFSIDGTECCCVVDSGFSFTHVVPTINTKVVENAIRRINVGGKILTNHLKEIISYRQWNMMEEFSIVNEAKEKTCYVSTNFVQELLSKASASQNKNETDVDFILPDFVNTLEGKVVVHNQRSQTIRKAKKVRTDVVVAVEDEFVETHLEDSVPHEDAEYTTIEDDDEDEETEEERLLRIRKQKQEESRRREMEEQERQILKLSTERFCVPEVLFSPAYIGLHKQCGLVEAIYQSIEACPKNLRAAMYQNILLIGGNAKLPNIRERIETDLRKLSSCKVVRVVSPPSATDDPTEYTWKGAKQFVSSNDNLELYQKYSKDKSAWERHAKDINNKDGLWADVQKQFIYYET